MHAWIYLFTATYIYFNLSKGLRHWFIHQSFFLLIILMNNYAVEIDSKTHRNHNVFAYMYLLMLMQSSVELVSAYWLS